MPFVSIKRYLLGTPTQHWTRQVNTWILQKEYIQKIKVTAEGVFYMDTYEKKITWNQIH
jgi:hypothetical protein